MCILALPGVRRAFMRETGFGRSPQVRRTAPQQLHSSPSWGNNSAHTRNTANTFFCKE